jgi:hypothetical protein
MTNLPPVPARENYDDVDPDSLVFALFLNPLYDADPIDSDRPDPLDDGTQLKASERIKQRRQLREKSREK